VNDPSAIFELMLCLPPAHAPAQVRLNGQLFIIIRGHVSGAITKNDDNFGIFYFYHPFG
jgi:hypothetical protein